MIFLPSSQQDQKLNKNRGSISWNRKIDFYTDSKSIKHFCKLLTKSRDFLYLNFDRLTDRCKPKYDMYMYSWDMVESILKWHLNIVLGLIDLTIRHCWTAVLNSMNIDRNQWTIGFCRCLLDPEWIHSGVWDTYWFTN